MNDSKTGRRCLLSRIRWAPIEAASCFGGIEANYPHRVDATEGMSLHDRRRAFSKTTDVLGAIVCGESVNIMKVDARPASSEALEKGGAKTFKLQLYRINSFITMTLTSIHAIAKPQKTLC